MLSADNPINEAEIFEVRALAQGHPVFLLLGDPNTQPRPSVVIKAETTISPSQSRGLSLVTRIITAVDVRARQYTLSAAELSDLDHWCQGEATFFGRKNADLNYLMLSLTNPSATWVRMDARSLSDLDQARALLVASSRDKKGVRAIAAGLSAAGGLEALGQVVALDLFNGNNDRFGWPGPGTRNPKGGNYHFLQNLGNILLSEATDGTLSPIALDSFDPNSRFALLDHDTVAEQEADSGSGEAEWPGRLLGADRTSDLATYLRGCVDDLNVALGPRSRRIPFATKKRLPSNAVGRMQAGVNAAIVRLKDKLANDPTFTAIALMQDRRVVLNW